LNRRKRNRVEKNQKTWIKSNLIMKKGKKMYETLKETIYFSLPIVASLILSSILAYMYFKDRNKRKLVFSIGIFVSSFGFYNSVLTTLGGKPIFPSMSWLFVPMAFALLTAALSGLLKLKDFDKSFAVFLFGTGVALIAFFVQFSFDTLRLGLMVASMSIAAPILIHLFIKSREPDDLYFLLATLCFLFQGLVFDLGTSKDVPVLLSLFGVVFVMLMFDGPKTGNPSSIASFVVLENKLNEANQKLRSTQEKLLKSERLATIGELAGLIGHDLRNPLQGIAGAIYYLKTHSVTSTDEKGQEMIRNVETCITRSNKIINDLIEYSQAISLQLSLTNPKTLAESALSQIVVPANIEVVNRALTHPQVNIDRERVERVFVSILKNAFDAMPNGGRLTIESKSTVDAVSLSFRDTGTGITEEVFAKMWTPLFTTKAKGMGFGLAICKRIIEAHSGEIKAETELGKGSKFIVTLPLNPKFEP
jgi:signal transduction histidine kinase